MSERTSILPNQQCSSQLRKRPPFKQQQKTKQIESVRESVVKNVCNMRLLQNDRHQTKKVICKSCATTHKSSFISSAFSAGE